MSQRRAERADEAPGPRIEEDGAVWRIRSLAVARQVLRARASTTQAGFSAEAIPQGFLKHHPILMSDGPLHDEQRRLVARFFAPAVIEDRYGELIAASADRLLEAAQVSPEPFLLDQLALQFSVEVTARAIGLNESSVQGLARRLESLFNQPPLDITKPDLGRSRAQWARAGINALVPIARFYLADVAPTIRARRKRRRDDLVSHLLDQGYTRSDILVECLTYASAGMVTTREFISMAALHLLRDDTLRAGYLAGDQARRFAILNELLRLDPVVGHLYRRVQQPLEIDEDGSPRTIPPGALVDLCVRDANADPAAVGPDPLGVCPARELPPGVNPAGLAFGDGAHRCPGQPLALHETDAFLTRLLRLTPVVVREPTLSWDTLVEGYQLRDFRLALPAR